MPENPMTTATLQPPWYWRTLPDGRVQCTLCPHGCRIAAGHRGACGVRVHLGGRLHHLARERVVAQHVDPIEKKPLFHFLPGSRTYSIASVGCAMSCTFCQNWEISQWPKQHLPRRIALAKEVPPGAVEETLRALASLVPGEPTTPEAIVEAARAAGCASIAYTYTEPTVFFELACETALLARRAGLKNVFVTSGYISEEPLRRIAGLLDAVNVDLKFYRDQSYLHVSRARLAPVLEAVRLYRRLGVWTEVTTLVIPGLNDSDEELRAIAAFVREVGEEVPWHVTGFQPCHEMLDRTPTPPATLRRAHAIGIAAGLRYVYEGNLVAGREDTRCHSCGALLIERDGFATRTNRIRDSRCPDCGTEVAGVEMSARRWCG